MEQFIGEEFPQTFSFQHSIQLSYHCGACGSADRFEFTPPGFADSGIMFMNPLSTKYYDAGELQTMAKRFGNVGIVDKESHTIVAGNDSSVPDSEKLPVNIFQRRCGHCGSITLFRYDIGYGQRERGLNEPNRLVVHDAVLSAV